jgi:hypothetical protein
MRSQGQLGLALHNIDHINILFRNLSFSFVVEHKVFTKLRPSKFKYYYQIHQHCNILYMSSAFAKSLPVSITVVTQGLMPGITIAPSTLIPGSRIASPLMPGFNMGVAIVDVVTAVIRMMRNFMVDQGCVLWHSVLIRNSNGGYD